MLNGVEKTQWNNIGTLTEFYKQDGTISRLIEIPAIGLEAPLFPAEEKTKPGQQTTTVAPTVKEYDGSMMPGELPPKPELSIDEIPF